MTLLLTNEDLRTLVSCLNSLMKHGYDQDFKVDDKGMRSLKTDRIYRPEEVDIINYFRFEGASDPGDSSILYAIETSDGAKGTLVDAFGPYGDSKVAAFMKEVEKISKKVDDVQIHH